MADGVGKLILNWIKSNKTNQTALAEKAGVSQKTISRWKNEETLPAPEFHAGLRKGLGCDKATLEAALAVTQARLEGNRKPATNGRRKRRPGRPKGGKAPATNGKSKVTLPTDVVAAPIAIPASSSNDELVNWIGRVVGAKELDPLAKCATVLFARFIESPQRLQAFVTPADLVNSIPEIKRRNVDQVWAKVVNSGFVRSASSSGRVFDLVIPN